ncbi:hypothetical protein HUT18_11100 [Streptomyces sp. NA04227]|uniref:hypothetical protein n=1 Tax=Streptomyces sp. NA04227 TaxID=2742136 RepID=UPI0015911606|nr:hypothetical protein [Streptomyces sp. NA04227]QKW06855.1 hypothetical protein HUT18_11100 [Streptomyces sp. NA04227]
MFLLVSQQVAQRAARRQAEDQSKRELQKWHREVRRQAYVDFIVAGEKFRHMILPLARALHDSAQRALTTEEETRLRDLLATLTERYDDLYEKSQVVCLEGPATIGRVAKDFTLGAARFRAAATQKAEAGTSAGHLPEEETGWQASGQKMNEALEAFIELAQGETTVA